MDGNAIYPPHEPFDTLTLPVGERHSLYVAQYGRTDGLPVVFLHGGPGSGCRPEQAQLFDPARFRIVLFDQRGAGRSTPKRCLIDNTTADLVADLERLRSHLGIDRWLVVGGSWGSTLGVAYAEQHPDRVMGLILRAVFLGTAAEARWAFSAAAQTFYPELWRSLVSLFEGDERADPITALGRRLEDPDPRRHKPAARVWNDYERALSSLRPNSLTVNGPLFDARASDTTDGPNTPYVEWHYIKNDCFLTPGQLLNRAQRLSGIEGIVVQGRYDMLCPPHTAHALCRHWPEAELRIVADAGHAASEPGIRQALLRAVKDMIRRLT